MAIANNMVWRLGMGKSGLVGNYTLLISKRDRGGRELHEMLSEDVKIQLNKDTNAILKDCLEDVEKTLKSHVQILDHFARELLKREELEYDEIIAIFKEYGIEETPFSEAHITVERENENDNKT